MLSFEILEQNKWLSVIRRIVKVLKEMLDIKMDFGKGHS
jgi:hypothetical protein